GPKWNDEEFIYVKNEDVRSFLNIEGKYASINSFREQSTNRLKFDIVFQYQKSYEKSEAYKTKFDKELIKTIERYFIIESIQQGHDLSIYPTLNKEKKWSSLFDIVFENS